MHIENVVKVIITVFLIGLIVLFVTFFTILGLTPTQRLGKALEAKNATSSETGTPLTNLPNPLLALVSSTEESAPRPAASQPSSVQGSGETQPGTVVYLNQGPPGGVTATLNHGEIDVTKFAATFNGQKELWFHSVDATYTVKIPAYGLSQTINAGETRLIAFQATQRGTFDVMCDGCAPDFKATLIVQ